MKEHIIRSFVDKFNLKFNQLSPTDVDYKILDKSGKIIAYAQVEHQEDLSKPFVIKAERMVRLFNKRLNGVVLFGNQSEVYYCKIDRLTGVVSPAKHNSIFDEFVISYENKDDFVII